LNFKELIVSANSCIRNQKKTGIEINQRDNFSKHLNRTICFIENSFLYSILITISALSR